MPSPLLLKKALKITNHRKYDLIYHNFNLKMGNKFPVREIYSTENKLKRNLKRFI